MGKNKSKARASATATVFEPRLLAATFEQAQAMLQEAGSQAQALIDAWMAQGNAAALDGAACGSCPEHKNARRALAVLKSRGITPPAREPSTPAAQPPAVSVEAWFSPPDTFGVGLITVGSHSTGERWTVADVSYHDDAGLIDVSFGEATRGSIRAGFERAKEQRGVVPVAVPLHWARWRLAQLKALNSKSGMLLPLGLDLAAPLLEPVPSEPPPHPIDAAELVPEEREIEPRSKASASLHNEPEFAGWLPEPPMIQELLTKVGERLAPNPNDKTADQLNAAMGAELIAITDRFFTPDVRNRVAARMKDCAISVLARAGRDRALDVLATAEAARRAGLITSPPSDIPFLRFFFDKALAVMAASSGGRLAIPVPTAPRSPSETTSNPQQEQDR